jgi:subtilisin-like proprotein convertase family protein
VYLNNLCLKYFFFGGGKMRPLNNKLQFTFNFNLTTAILLSVCLLFVSNVFAQKKVASGPGDNTRMTLNTYLPVEALPVTPPDNVPAGTNLTFNVSGLTGNLYHVRVENWTWSPQIHTWSGDIKMTLAAPGGSPIATITERRGRTTCTTGAGASEDLVGPYNFGDGYTGDFHTDLNINPVPAGNYRASRCVTTAGELVALDTTFAGPVIPPPPGSEDEKGGLEDFRNLSPEAANGIWTLNISDNAGGDTGNVSAVRLALQTAIPVAANAAIKGQVVDTNGRGISRARVVLTDTNTGNSKVFNTNSFGHFSFDELEVGHFFIISASHKRYQFPNGTQSFTLSEDLGGFEFVGTAN